MQDAPGQLVPVSLQGKMEEVISLLRIRCHCWFTVGLLITQELPWSLSSDNHEDDNRSKSNTASVHCTLFAYTVQCSQQPGEPDTLITDENELNMAAACPNSHVP